MMLWPWVYGASHTVTDGTFVYVLERDDILKVDTRDNSVARFSRAYPSSGGDLVLSGERLWMTDSGSMHLCWMSVSGTDGDCMPVSDTSNSSDPPLDVNGTTVFVGTGTDREVFRVDTVSRTSTVVSTEANEDLFALSALKWLPEGLLIGYSPGGYGRFHEIRLLREGATETEDWSFGVGGDVFPIQPHPSGDVYWMASFVMRKRSTGATQVFAMTNALAVRGDGTTFGFALDEDYAYYSTVHRLYRKRLSAPPVCEFDNPEDLPDNNYVPLVDFAIYCKD